MVDVREGVGPRWIALPRQILHWYKASPGSLSWASCYTKVYIIIFSVKAAWTLSAQWPTKHKLLSIYRRKDYIMSEIMNDIAHKWSGLLSHL